MCVCVCSGGTVNLYTQHCGDPLNFTRNTHDPPGCAAVGAQSEVLILSPAERLTCLFMCDSNPALYFKCETEHVREGAKVTPMSAEAAELSAKTEGKKEKREECKGGGSVSFFFSEKPQQNNPLQLL